MIRFVRFFAWTCLVGFLLVGLVAVVREGNAVMLGQYIATAAFGIFGFCILMLLVKIVENTRPAKVDEPIDEPK